MSLLHWDHLNDHRQHFTNTILQAVSCRHLDRDLISNIAYELQLDRLSKSIKSTERTRKLGRFLRFFRRAIPPSTISRGNVTWRAKSTEKSEFKRALGQLAQPCLAFAGTQRGTKRSKIPIEKKRNAKTPYKMYGKTDFLLKSTAERRSCQAPVFYF